MQQHDLLYLVDHDGKIWAVQLSYELWQKLEKVVAPYLQEKKTVQVQQQGPLDDFATLMQYWDFRYPYSPKVSCPHCGASTEDWQKDQKQPFILTNANLGGLLVFHCKNCGTTIRHKHFSDHVSYEHTTPKLN
ncbi:MAG: hypothetical protein IJS50_02970 [Desulfovibrio sp.]|nr:hypothetical protein [Desulfovibrio sp.]